MKKLLVWTLMLLCLAQAFAEEKIQVSYYFENYCESCSPEKDFAAQFKALTGTDLADCDYTYHNTVTTAGRAALDAAMETHGFSQAALPLAIVNGTVYQGTDSIQSEMPLDALEWGNGSDSTILYLYTPACESCARMDALLGSLPETVEIARGSITFSSDVHIERIDVTGNPAVARALFDAHSVPETERITPAVFLPGRCLIGSERIENDLLRYVRLGWAVGKIDLSAFAPADPIGAYSLLGTLSAGLIAGLNGCALSMLLMFVSLLLETRRHALPYAVAFLLAKLACYLLIGFTLIEVMQRANPTWLLPSARILLTLLGGAIILLNLRDAFFARKGALGQMRNQLPTGMRRGLHRVIRRLTGSRALHLACIALGVIVAAGEFLCAGQLYLASLLQSVQSGQSHARQSLTLILYCLAFLVPSVAVTAVVLIGRSTRFVSSLLARNIAAVKLLTAAAMLVLIVLSWLI